MWCTALVGWECVLLWDWQGMHSACGADMLRVAVSYHSSPGLVSWDWLHALTVFIPVSENTYQLYITLEHLHAQSTCVCHVEWTCSCGGFLCTTWPICEVCTNSNDLKLQCWNKSDCFHSLQYTCGPDGPRVHSNYDVLHLNWFWST